MSALHSQATAIETPSKKLHVLFVVSKNSLKKYENAFGTDLSAPRKGESLPATGLLWLAAAIMLYRKCLDDSDLLLTSLADNVTGTVSKSLKGYSILSFTNATLK